MQKRGFIILILFAVTSFLFGCGPTIVNMKIDEIGAYPHPLLKPLPIHAGVYYGDDFRAFKVTQEAGPSDALVVYNIEMGKANIALFDFLLSNVFENVTPILDILSLIHI